MTATIHLFEPTQIYQKSALKTVLVGGCFDVLHYGHLNFLSSAKNLAERLVVALEPDEKIVLSKKRPPIHSSLQRAEILANLRIVQDVFILPVLHSYDDYLNVVMKLQPDFLAVTNEDPQLKNKQQQALAASAELVIVNTIIESLSSSKIIIAALD